MEPVSITIITYVAIKFIDQFLAEDGYERIKSWFFPKKKYQDQLVSVIYDSIEEHEKHFTYDVNGSKLPFYHSQILFDELNKHILFSTHYTNEKVVEKLKENLNIFIPNTEELNTFYEAFTRRIKENKKLKKLFIDENYKTRIFDIYESIKSIEEKLTSIEGELSIRLDQDWFNRQCLASIQDLGNRYTPKLNFELELSEIFEGLGRTKSFKNNVTERFDQLIMISP